MLLYYFFTELIPAIAALNTHDILVNVIHEMCNRDVAITLAKVRRGYFG
jgi:hypothetical protein